MNSKRLVLGDDFVGEPESAYESIKSLPETWPKFGQRTRRFLLTKFPYAIVCKPVIPNCHVVAVMHQSRKPGNWLDRA